MMELVKISNKEPVTSTLIIADGMKLKHRAVMFLVDKYKNRLEMKGILTVELLKIKEQKRGRPSRYAWLNEEQTMFLVTLMKNSETVLDFKALLTKEFIKQRKLIAYLLTQTQNAEWQELRSQGKLARRQETDTIKQFIEYCKSQGSTHSEKYYFHLSKMENKALFIVEQEFPNLRDVLSGQQLHIIASADIAVAKALQEGMDKELPYQEIYKLAKERMEKFAEIVGKTIVPLTPLIKEAPLTLF